MPFNRLRVRNRHALQNRQENDGGKQNTAEEMRLFLKPEALPLQEGLTIPDHTIYLLLSKDNRIVAEVAPSSHGVVRSAVQLGLDYQNASFEAKAGGEAAD